MPVTSNFDVTIRAFCGKSKARVKKIQQLIAQKMLNEIVDLTPVDTGRAKGNWNVNESTPDESYVWDKMEPSGSATKAAGAAKISQMSGKSIYITNGIPYMEFLEDGWSRTQAPAGITKVALAMRDDIIDEALRELGEA